MDEGYIKFKCDWIEESLLDEVEINELSRWVSFLKKENLIGVYPDGIGFGNVSVRHQAGFVITGTQTGGIEILEREHFAFVDKYDLKNNSISCIGMTKASSESMTHAAIYEVAQDCQAVVHVHSKYLWDKYIHKLPTTEEIPYGTPEMAFELQRLIKENDRLNVVVMAGHEEGIIAFGASLKEACLKLITL